MIWFRGRKRARPRTGQSSDPAAYLCAGARGAYCYTGARVQVARSKHINRFGNVIIHLSFNKYIISM